MQIVIALGGNALLRRGEPLTTENQLANTRLAAVPLAAVARKHKVVLTHGNGPQVGLLSLQADAYATSHEEVPAYPLDVMGAATAGMIGYMLEQELGNQLGYSQPVATLLTRVVVDRNDPEFQNPTKFVGPVVDEEQAQQLSDRKGWTFRQDGNGWRRVVPSPQPQQIVWHRPIRWLLAQDALVICGGGGGIPMTYLPGGQTMAGVEAVIDKDRASGLLASELPAELFVMATDVDGVYVDFGKPSARRLEKTCPAELEALGFAKGSMGPKVEAACAFVRATGNPAVIGQLEAIENIVDGFSGTWIYPDDEG